MSNSSTEDDDMQTSDEMIIRILLKCSAKETSSSWLT